MNWASQRPLLVLRPKAIHVKKKFSDNEEVNAETETYFDPNTSSITKIPSIKMARPPNRCIALKGDYVEQ